jgi:hypothetical protein
VREWVGEEIRGNVEFGDNDLSLQRFYELRS